MKKTRASVLSILLSVCMVMTMLPTVAFAEEGDQNSGMPLGISSITAFAPLEEAATNHTVPIMSRMTAHTPRATGYIYLGIGTGGTSINMASSSDGTGWSWDADTLTLMLTDITIGGNGRLTTAPSTSVDITIEVSGVVQATSLVHTDGKLTLTGNGTLTVATAGNGSGSISGKAILIDGPTVSATTSQDSTNAIDVGSGNPITVNSGELHATATGNLGVGLNGDLTVNGGIVTASGKLLGSLTVSEGTVTIEGEVKGAQHLTGGTVLVNGVQVWPIQNFVAVTGISGVLPRISATLTVPLTATVEPANATNKYIEWSVKDAGTTGAEIIEGNKLKTTAVGTVTLTATILNGMAAGTAYTEDFTFTVSPYYTINSGTISRTGDTTATIGFTTSHGGTAYYLDTDNSVMELEAAYWESNRQSLGSVSAGAVTGLPITLQAGDRYIWVRVQYENNTWSPVLRITAQGYQSASVTVDNAAELKTALENTTAQTIDVTTDFALTEVITTGANHTLAINNGIALTVGQQGGIKVETGKLLTLTGGGTLRSIDTNNVLHGGGTVNLKSVTAQMENFSGGIRNVDVTVDNGAKIILNSTTSDMLLNIRTGRTIAVNTGGSIEIKNYKNAGIHVFDTGVLHINGGTVHIAGVGTTSAEFQNGGRAAAGISMNQGKLKISNGGQITSIAGGVVWLFEKREFEGTMYAGTKLEGVAELFRAGNYIPNSNNEIEVGDTFTNQLTGGDYKWEGNRFAKGSGTSTITPAAVSSVAFIKDRAYNGKAHYPPLVVTGSNGKTLVKNTDYTVAYRNNVKPGKAYATVTGRNNYTGTKVVTFRIAPKKVSIGKVTSPKAGTIKATWKRDKLATGYQATAALNSKFTKGKKTINIKKNKTTKATFKKLKKGKKYYVKVRAYKTIDGKRCYGSYSKVKKVRVR